MGPQEDNVFAFEKLDAYRCAIEFLAVSAQLIAELPRGYSSLSDQRRRAALSTAVNLAEGVGRAGAADARRHYAIARGSAMECAAILDACRVLGVGRDDLREQGRGLLIRVVQMTTKMGR